jgi:hypothetical protein
MPLYGEDQLVAIIPGPSRRRQIAYADFQIQGYPIGSGMVESANKLVVEQRLKGAGMHWARRNVTPMLALRAVTRTSAGSTGAGTAVCFPAGSPYTRAAQRPTDEGGWAPH